MKIHRADEKGFSLVEVIFVIAIVAFLVCVTVPLLLKYMEKTKLTADTQMANTVKMMVTATLSDPKVVNADNTGIPQTGTLIDLSSATDFQGAFGEVVAQRLGYDSVALMTDSEVGIVSQLQMKDASIITIMIDGDGSCRDVTIWSRDGNKLISVH